MASLVLPSNYAYVALAAAGTLWLNIYQIMTVSKARKAAGLKYPIYMAENSVAEKDPKAYRFNCCQRAHANTLETVPTFLFALLYSGRFLYTIGYATGQPQLRNTSGGVVHNVGYLGLMLLSTYIAGSKTYNLLF
ncbi:hypothetical protein QFC21_003544 [Naganishia friedmannii]|uniref:Uncharacterized protein n=1 Tax=Naganishia friedmannii TaxID=89922 RepID=A0ACC2VN38_9TREE|nr:hypothetical protein QFC21_003544 [Naganishia friedmannii]